MVGAPPSQALESLHVSASKPVTKELKRTEKRDFLVSIEKKYQRRWEEDGVFHADAPPGEDVPVGATSASDLHEKYPKYFVIMAYPYMNGTLHAGHSFSVSKSEFAAGYARMQGRRVLFPMGFHCTGMPVKACADKLVNELAMFGREFEKYKEAADDEQLPAEPASKAVEDPTKFSAKKGKAAAKTVKLKYQFQIMLAMGIPLQDIHLFADTKHWLEFFPGLCRRDLSNFGARIDWRRSMVTTDANPYYDAFVRWQMNRLKDLGKIKFGKRYTVYSMKDGQPCMDHDRSEGEGVGPQEYTALKMQVLEWAPGAQGALEDKLPDGVDVFLVPATLRPETLYGQTCCFVGPTINYGIFRASEREYYVVTDRAARNMAYQGIFARDSEIEKVAEIRGSDLVGCLVNAPLSLHDKGVRVLPMETVSPLKGTGVVTSVPSDSPDDLITVTTLAKKADYYGIEREWAEAQIYPIIDTPTYGDLCATVLVKELKITSPKDVKQLERAKELAYKEGYYQGTLKVGEYRGQTVEMAKPKIRQQLIDAGAAFPYCEPERKVISRSGDDCIVALMDQWYLDYGEESWKKAALEWVANADGKGMNTFHNETRHAFNGALNWLNQWACARSYGLGSKLPWDPQFLVESLSDSTIYMSYYTIAHILHKDIFGKEKGAGGIAPEQMTDSVWDYVFCLRELDNDLPTTSGIPKATLEAMRREFEYWYPLDLSVSGKDLLPNHMTFSIYAHLAVFRPEHWPTATRINGHLLLNGEKMSKSTGNFMTLDDMICKYGADASRIALADAGDNVADANFDENVADNNILRLYNLRHWCKEIVGDQDQLRDGSFNGFQDALFDNEMNSLVAEAQKHFEATNYKAALKAGFYDFINARDFYREACNLADIKMHKDLALRYVELQALLLCVVAPHWAEHVWLDILKKPASIHYTRYPVVPPANMALTAVREYVRVTANNINSGAQQKRKSKNKGVEGSPREPKRLTIFLANSFPAWQEKYVDLVRSSWDTTSRSFRDEKVLNGRIAQMGEMERAMPFVQALKQRLLAGEPENNVLERKLAFDEVSVLGQMLSGLKKTAGLTAIDLVLVDEDGKHGKTVGGDGGQFTSMEGMSEQARNARPGQPTFAFQSMQ
ncbi:leucine--tRNA ligase [Diplogelasinospora grovesii]|uniref:leucine--tRNA ligase n=1 Tax=Diplogelasinospora grovesii TaxID=303347 RepID=A0AAN6NFT8_9PEZI|nr:leucine--tRNA ligase [Diplogelasinospora grovesii]